MSTAMGITGKGSAMKYIGLAFIATVLLIAAWTMATIQPMIPALVAGATDTLAFVVRACVGTAMLVASTGGVWFMLRQQYERDRKRDGAFAVRMVHLQPLPMRLAFWLMGRTSARVMVDMNASPTPFVGIDHNGLFQVEPAWGHDRQLAYALDNNKTERVQAAIAGDAVLGNPLVSLQRGIGGVANAATGRMLAGAYDKPVKQSTFVSAQPEPARLPAPELTGAEAVEQSTPASIVMGQTDSGDLVRWNMTQTPHLRFHGMTQGSGKTNAIQTVAAGALATGAHVVICDRVQFKDWGDFDGRAELVDTTDPQRLADACARLYNIYLGRTEQLRAAGVRNIAQHGGMQRIVVVISEFGAQMASARNDSIGRQVEYPLTQLARLAASTGIHLVAEDQVVKGWPRELAGNLVPVIGRMPAHAGQACGYQGRGGGTDTFRSYTFWYEGALFQTPHMEPALPSIMAMVSEPKALVMRTPAAVIPGEDGAAQTVSQSVSERVFSGVSPEVAPPPSPATNTGNTDPKWDEFILDYMAKHRELWQTPPRGVRELARAMSRHDTGKEDFEDSYVGIASKTTKRFREEAYLPNGAKLGTDITGGAI